MNSQLRCLLLATTTLAGCAHGPTAEEVAATATERCAHAGYERGSNANARCAQEIVNAKRRQDAVNQQRIAQIMMAIGFGMMAASAPPPAQPAPTQDRVCIAPNNALYRC